MSKLSATLSKKVPIPGLEYSSQQFSCGLEMELSGEQTQDTIRQNIHKMYLLLHQAIDREIQLAVDNPPMFMNTLQSASRCSSQPDASRWRGRSYGDNRQTRWSKPGGGSRCGTGRQTTGRATQAQVKAIFAIAKENGMERRDVVEMLEERFNVVQPDDLSVKQASKLIEALKEDGGRD
ncbi:MAG: hypothetical protein LUG50_07325 [Planctomycetaceae bacterium]|nr:hypothetical protein [Planctomycetaceae bacterium]